jgi:feruloyl-CoA synthase
MCTSEQEAPGNVGVPAYGVELKLVPVEGRFEARVRGPSITPGYWRDPALTAKSFDEEGFYRLGDALRFADPKDANRGFFFDGRVAENFKLRTGTWVNVGALRAAFIDHFGLLVRDVVLTGLDREFVGALVFPDIAACRALLPQGSAANEPRDIVRDPSVVRTFESRLTSFAQASHGSSTLVRKAILLEDPPSFDTGEITDKGSINQRHVAQNRSALVEAIYARGSAEQVVVLSIEDEEASRERGGP